MSKRTKQIEEQIAKLDAKRAALVKKRDEVTGRTLVQCQTNQFGKGCGTKHQIRTLVYIRTHWYVQPHGCTGGDYWNEGEGNYVCPDCGHRNRLTSVWGGGEAREKLSEHKYQFKSIVDEHKRDY